jgi:opacity protein-like surface antigen
VLAGTSAKQVIPSEPAQPWSWFAGGSVGMLNDFDEELYSLHVGADTPWSVAGWNIALFGEIGFGEKEKSFSPDLAGFDPNSRPDSFNFDLDSLNSSMQFIANAGSVQSSDPDYRSSYDLDVMPVIFNVKLERQLTGNLGAYFGAGIGASNIDLSANFGANQFIGGSASADDWVLTVQAFAGLVYNITPAIEVYGGARWISFSKASLKDGDYRATLNLGDDTLIELGARYNF